MSKGKRSLSPQPFATFPVLFDDVNGAEENTIINLEEQQGETVIFQSQGATVIDGKFQSELEFDGAIDRTLTFTEHEATIEAGDLLLDLSLGTHFYFTHDADTTITLTNVPTGDGVVVVLQRNKDAGEDIRAIDWAGSSAIFDNAPDDLTQTSEAQDTIYLVTKDGGATYNVSVSFDERLV